MNLVIAEKPSMGMDIAKAIGLAGGARNDGYVECRDDYVVTWAVGHLLQQAAPEAYGEEYASWDVAKLPIVPTDWKMEAGAKTAKQLKVIGALLKKARCVVNAGDSAREGQLIVDEVLDHFGYKGQTKRLWLHELNTPAIRKAIAAMKDNKEYRTLYESALARQRSDWLMGMNLTRGYTSAWKSRGNGGVLHVGRVQTPTLCMVVERDLEIENFVPKDYFVLRGRMRHKNGEFVATWQPPEGADCLDQDGRIVRKDVADAVAKKVQGKTAAITDHETKGKSQSAPLPFSLGGLQKAANKAIGLSPSDTLEVAQSLYETHKLTSYPRTDYSHLPEGEHGMSKDIIEAAKSCFGSAWDFPGTPDFSIKSAAWDSSKIGDHHGIRPTMVRDYDLSKLSSRELAVYRMIVRQFLAQFYPPYKYDATGVTLVAEGETFKATGTVEKSPGWKVLFRGNKEEAQAGDAGEGEEGEGASLPPMAKGDSCLVAEANVESKKTSPPPRFNGASIIDAMERAHLFVSDERIKKVLKETGIGTPATRAAIVENLVGRGYIEEQGKGKKKFYISTARGRALYGAMPNELRKPDLTAYFEELLKQVEAGKLGLPDFFDRQVKFVTKLVDDIKSGKAAERIPKDLAPPDEKKTGGKSAPKPRKAGKGEKACPECGSAMRERTSAKGKFWGCSAYPTCKKTMPFEEKEAA